MFSLLKRLQSGQPVWMSEVVDNLSVVEDITNNKIEWWFLAHPDKSILGAGNTIEDKWYTTKYFMIVRRITSYDTGEEVSIETFIVRRPPKLESKWVKEIIQHTNLPIAKSWQTFFSKLFADKKMQEEKKDYSIEARAHVSN
jgi:hypothetical protein